MRMSMTVSDTPNRLRCLCFKTVDLANVAMQGVVTQDPHPSMLAWMMICVAALLGWRWIV